MRRREEIHGGLAVLSNQETNLDSEVDTLEQLISLPGPHIPSRDVTSRATNCHFLQPNPTHPFCQSTLAWDITTHVLSPTKAVCFVGATMTSASWASEARINSPARRMCQVRQGALHTYNLLPFDLCSIVIPISTSDVGSSTKAGKLLYGYLPLASLCSQVPGVDF